MGIQHEQDEISKLILKGELKKQLMDYYDDIKFEIYIIEQELLETIQNDKEKERIVAKNQFLIDQLIRIYNKSVAELDNYFNTSDIVSNDKEEIMQKAITKSCYFIKKDTKKTGFHNWVLIGLLVVADWYLDQSQINFIRFLNEKMYSKDVKENDLAHFKIVFDKNMLDILYAFRGWRTKERSSRDQFRIRRIKTGEFVSCNVDLKDLNICDVKPNSFEHLDNDNKIISLSITRNEQLEKVNPDIFNGLEKIKILSFFGCSFKELNGEMFEKLKRLEIFNIGCNKFESLNESMFFNLPCLEKLSLISCLITEIKPNTFSQLPRLKYLDLSYNEQFEVLHKDTFVGLKNIHSIRMNGCLIAKLDDDTFAKIPSLKELWLGGNKIKSLNEESFNGLTNLVELYLDRLNVNVIKANTFRKLKNLKKLDLCNGKIESIEDGAFNGVAENLTVLSLVNNPIDISCFDDFKQRHSLIHITTLVKA